MDQDQTIVEAIIRIWIERVWTGRRFLTIERSLSVSGRSGRCRAHFGAIVQAIPVRVRVQWIGQAAENFFTFSESIAIRIDILGVSLAP
jgi:hypothetical protein